jgi:hypothetical protein
MSDQDNYKTYVRATRTTESNGVGMAIIVGGLVVAVGFVLWFLFGAFVPSSTAPADGDTNVTIENPAAPAPDASIDPVVPAEPVPAEPAPADPAPDAAPVDPAAPAPVDE